MYYPKTLSVNLFTYPSKGQHGSPHFSETTVLLLFGYVREGVKCHQFYLFLLSTGINGKILKRLLERGVVEEIP